MLPAYDLFHKLRRADFNANHYQDLNMMAEFFHYLNEQYVVIAFSYSGQSQEVLYPCRMVKSRNASIIHITRKRESPLNGISDICLSIPDIEAVTRIGAFPPSPSVPDDGKSAVYGSYSGKYGTL